MLCVREIYNLEQAHWRKDTNPDSDPTFHHLHSERNITDIETRRRSHRRAGYPPVPQRKDPVCSRLCSRGVFLLVVYGFLPIIFVFGLWTQKKWAWTLTLLLGLTEIAWIVTEVVLLYNLGFIFFYPLIAGMGIVTAALCLLPSVRRFYSRPNITEKIRTKSITEKETIA